MTTTRTPKELADYLAGLGYNAFTENHAAGPGGPSLPTVKLSDGTYVIVSARGDGVVDDAPMGDPLVAVRYRADEDGWIDFGESAAHAEGGTAEIVAALAAWERGESAPEGTDQ